LEESSEEISRSLIQSFPFRSQFHPEAQYILVKALAEAALELLEFLLGRKKSSKELGHGERGHPDMKGLRPREWRGHRRNLRLTRRRNTAGRWWSSPRAGGRRQTGGVRLAGGGGRLAELPAARRPWGSSRLAGAIGSAGPWPVSSMGQYI
jgi:hypothetical protein